ncbi:MAG: cysteine synthase A [Myxococcota bacterium]
MNKYQKRHPKIARNMTQLIGNTPLVETSNSNKRLEARIIAKLEFFNPLSSVKDRPALAMIQQAEGDGKLSSGITVVEPSSGNTGIGLAFVCAARGYDLIIVMPDTMTLERRKLLAALGAKVILTDGKQGMKGAIDKAEELAASNQDYLILQQFKNPANSEIHRQTTALEIFEDTEGKVDIFVAGIGTGGTITGVGQKLKELQPEVKIVAVEPENSAVLSGEKAGPHKIQGLGAGFIPDILETDVIDEIIKISNGDAFKYARKLAREEGIFAGISSGAAMAAAVELAERPENEGLNIVVIFPDTGERYLSSPLYS